MQTIDDRTAMLRQANDILRSSMLTGNVFMHPDFAALPSGTRAALVGLVRRTRQFDDDAIDTHAAGTVQLQALRLRWRIRALDSTLTKPSPDPSDPLKTRRVLNLELL